ILADVCESIVGAVYLDGGHDAARALVARSFGLRLHAPVRPLRDAKTQLQEWAQGQGKPAPTYHLGARSGPDHAPLFVIDVHVAGLTPATGEGRSKRDAEQAAAQAMLARENVTGVAGA
ncbi:MAG: ribonuclease III family protein, partial [Beijerinckiaceae bacterium]